MKRESPLKSLFVYSKQSGKCKSNALHLAKIIPHQLHPRFLVTKAFFSAQDMKESNKTKSRLVLIQIDLSCSITKLRK